MSHIDHLVEFSLNRDLVTVNRAHIDANSIQGFILGHSDDLLLLQYVYDFRLDGLLVLRVADITDIQCSATGKFQKKLLIAEGLFQKVPFDLAVQLKDWKTVITQFSQQYRLMILEDENPDIDLFLIGEVEKITKSSVSLKYFSGAANWDAKPTKLLLRNITSCQVDTNYLNVYQRYFDQPPH